MNNNFSSMNWLNSWETNKQYNIEVGLNNGKLIKGYLIENEFSSLEQLPDIKSFLELEKFKPKLYDDNQFEYGEFVCYVEGEKFRVVYHYDKEVYMIMNSNDDIIRRIEK